jgi:hypothetical protein
MDSSCSCGKSDYFFIFTDERLEVGFEAVYVRTERHHPIGVESLLYELLFVAAHVSEAEIYAIHFFSY